MGRELEVGKKEAKMQIWCVPIICVEENKLNIHAYFLELTLFGEFLSCWIV